MAYLVKKIYAEQLAYFIPLAVLDGPLFHVRLDLLVVIGAAAIARYCLTTKSQLGIVVTVADNSHLS